MRMMVFAGRSGKEMLRDPLTLVFGLGFPVGLLVMMQMMMRSMPGMAGAATQFSIGQFAPAMAVFGQSFLTLFLGMLVSADRGSSFLARLFASPLRAWEYLLGYSLPLLPIALGQGAICFATALCLGLKCSWALAAAVLVLVPVSLLFIATGLLIGACLRDRQVNGVGSIFVNVATLLSGAWFPLELMSGKFKQVCYLLPFAHAVDAVRAAAAGSYGEILPHLVPVLLYAAALAALAAVLFRRKMRQ